MTDPAAKHKPKPFGPKTLTASAAVLTLLGAMLIPTEKRVHYPYVDPAGILTVCEGLIGPWIEMRHYTDAECETRTQAYLDAMSKKMGACVGPLTREQWLAWGHFTYNTGTGAFCKSTAAKLLRQEEHVAACSQMKRWTFITVKGKPTNCRTAGKTCPGIVTRRDYEHQLCMDSLK